MKLFSSHHQSLRRQRQRGLTLLEIMVASALLLIIIFGLMLMFNQTQRAFRSGLKQVDVLEAGRAALEVIARDVEQMDSANRSDATNVWIGMQTALTPVTFLTPSSTDWSGTKPIPSLQTNYIQSLFFLRDTPDWQGIGFRVLNMPLNSNLTARTDNVLVGTLYRFQMDNASYYSGELQTNLFLQEFTNGVPTFYITNSATTNGTFRRIIDGVVHFHVRPYDGSGRLVTNAPPNVVVEADLLSFNPTLNNFGPPRSIFSGSAMPAYLELELGILEPQALEQLKPLITSGNTTAIAQFLSDHAGKIHIFRQTIPVRTVSR